MVVGDEDQCLVEGTMVTMGDGSQRPIEQLKEGDAVMSCHGSADFRPSPVTGVFKAWEKSGVEINDQKWAQGRQHPRAHALRRISAGHDPSVAPDLLDVEAGSRVQGRGDSGVYTQRGRSAVGIRQRCLHEHADAVWVISTHDSDAEARAAEISLSLRLQPADAAFLSPEVSFRKDLDRQPGVD